MRVLNYSVAGLFSGGTWVCVDCARLCASSGADVGAGLFALLGCVYAVLAGFAWLAARRGR